MSTPPDAHLWPSRTTVTEGAWSVDGLSLADIAEEFGTPSYVLDVATLRERARRYRDALAGAFAPQGIEVDVYYASKAFSSTAVLRWVHEEGLAVDVASLGELSTALKAQVPPTRLGLHGNNKSDDELDLAVRSGVGRIVVDSLEEIERLAQVAAAHGVRQGVLVRVTTGVHAGGHDFIATAHEDQKFGLSLATGAARRALETIAATTSLRLLGLHSHIGSQITGSAGFAAAAQALLGLRADFAADQDYVMPEVDLGGGFGVAYTPGEQELDITAAAGELAEVVRSRSSRDGLPAPAISFEPGRAIIAPAMLTLYRVGTCKPVRTEEGTTRLYVSVDGGMSDNLRPALYGADYHAQVVGRDVPGDTVAARVVGMHCESGDIVVRDVRLPAGISRGDLLAVPVTGAYGRSMASNYNLVPRPGVVAVQDGAAREIVRRESVADLLALDVG
ncbi:diaminopimelate decarboxylase [Pseudactinotalea sp. Z1732]|uniref:diaminopimelate decarboxylase n=1 Tax=Pseudactinotalea sp. Z1732 TaxID=3413026 RepID=UPI003C7C0750